MRGRQRPRAHRAHARTAGRSRTAEGSHARAEGAEGRARRVGAEWVAEKAVAIAVFPSVKKGGLVVGGHFGRGVLSAKSAKSGTWSSPSFLTLTGGSLGLQIGGQAVDLVLVVVDQRGLEQLLKNQFKVGGDASVAAGPVGRDAEASTDIQMRAKILSYSRTRGLFAGITLKGSTDQARTATPTSASTAAPTGPPSWSSTASAAPPTPSPPGATNSPASSSSRGRSPWGRASKWATLRQKLPRLAAQALTAH